MDRPRARLVALVLATVGIAAVSGRTVLASEPAPSEDARLRAKGMVERGTQLFDEGRYEEALAVFEDAAVTWASADMHFNIGLCHERLGRYDVAIRSFEAYLRNKPGAADRVSVEHRIELLRRAQRAPEVPPEVAPASAADPVATAEPGQREAAVAPPPASAQPTDRDASPNGRGMTIAGGVLFSAGTLFAVAGGVAFGLAADVNAGRVNAVLEGGNPEQLTFLQTREYAADADRDRALTYTCVGTGVALAATGIALMVVGRKRARRHAWLPEINRTAAGFALGVKGAF